jgi:hypothetical protein
MEPRPTPAFPLVTASRQSTVQDAHIRQMIDCWTLVIWTAQSEATAGVDCTRRVGLRCHQSGGSTISNGSTPCAWLLSSAITAWTSSSRSKAAVVAAPMPSSTMMMAMYLRVSGFSAYAGGPPLARSAVRSGAPWLATVVRYRQAGRSQPQSHRLIDIGDRAHVTVAGDSAAVRSRLRPGGARWWPSEPPLAADRVRATPAGPALRAALPRREHLRSARDALTEALRGVDLGAFDREIVEWLAAWDTLATVMSLLHRTRKAGRDERPREGQFRSLPRLATAVSVRAERSAGAGSMS